MANLLVLDGRVIGGDICSVELNGFIHGFVNPNDTASLTQVSPGEGTASGAEAASPEAYVKENGRFPILETTSNESGDIVIVTGDNNGSFVRYTFTE